MTVKNMTNKPIGVGNVIILPEEIKEISETKKHPVVAFFLSKGYLKFADLPTRQARKPNPRRPPRTQPPADVPPSEDGEMAEDSDKSET
ncbi:MAG: hypothetical protein FWG65_09765 [Turicibacter sp.]|nr:hypothetical protein [Turicibacter sp.]